MRQRWDLGEDVKPKTAARRCTTGNLHRRGTPPVIIYLIVDDVDAFVDRAVDAGTKIVMTVEDQFWGDRYGQIEDPFRHPWSVANPKRSMSEGEIRGVTRAAMARSK